MQPYREFFQSPPETLILWPDAGRRTLVGLGAVLIIMIAVAIVASSTMVAIQCDRSGTNVSCTTNESTFVTSSRFNNAATGVTGFALRSSGSGKSRKEWLTMVSPAGETGITTSSVPSQGRAEALERLNDFAQDASQTSAQAIVGSRWGGMRTLPFLCIGLAFVYFIMGSRIRATVERSSGRVRVESRLWPLPVRGIDFTVGTLMSFSTETGSKGNVTRIVVQLVDGTVFPLTRAYTSSNKREALDKLEEFVRGTQ